MDLEPHGACASITKRCAHMPQMIVSRLKRIKASRMNPAENEKQSDTKRAKILERRRENVEGKNRMSRVHGR